MLQVLSKYTQITRDALFKNFNVITWWRDYRVSVTESIWQPFRLFCKLIAKETIAWANVVLRIVRFTSFKVNFVCKYVSECWIGRSSHVEECYLSQFIYQFETFVKTIASYRWESLVESSCTGVKISVFWIFESYLGNNGSIGQSLRAIVIFCIIYSSRICCT